VWLLLLLLLLLLLQEEKQEGEEGRNAAGASLSFFLQLTAVFPLFFSMLDEN